MLVSLVKKREAAPSLPLPVRQKVQSFNIQQVNNFIQVEFQVETYIQLCVQLNNLEYAELKITELSSTFHEKSKKLSIGLQMYYFFWYVTAKLYIDNMIIGKEYFLHQFNY